MQKAVEDAREFLKIFGVTITTERRNIDISNPALYETSWSWSRLLYGTTKSLSSSYIYGLASAEQAGKADCIGIIVDKTKALYEDEDLWGQQSTFGNKQVIEVYCENVKAKKFGFPRYSYVLIHEIFHALADHFNVADGLHKYQDNKKNKTLDAYRLEFLALIAKYPNGLLPRVHDAAEKLVSYAENIGMPIRITEGYRSPERQNELYKQKPKVTNAKAWESMHQYRIAFDIVFRKEGYNATNKQWEALVEGAKKLDLEWGGDWKGFIDKPHFQLTFGKELKDFQKGKIDWAAYYTLPVITPPQPPVSPPVVPPVPPKPKARFTKTLTYGMRDPQVAVLQDVLRREGLFPLYQPSTGYFGDITSKGVLAWQQRYNERGVLGTYAEIKALNGRSFGPKSRAVANKLYK